MVHFKGVNFVVCELYLNNNNKDWGVGDDRYHLKKKVCHSSQDQDTCEVLIITLGKYKVGQK